MHKDEDVDSIVQNFAANELSSLDRIGADAKSLQLSPKYTQQRAAPPSAVKGPSAAPENSKRHSSTSSSRNSFRKSTTPSEISIESPKSSFGERFKSFRRIASGKK